MRSISKKVFYLLALGLSYGPDISCELRSANGTLNKEEKSDDNHYTELRVDYTGSTVMDIPYRGSKTKLFVLNGKRNEKLLSIRFLCRLASKDCAIHELKEEFKKVLKYYNYNYAEATGNFCFNILNTELDQMQQVLRFFEIEKYSKYRQSFYKTHVVEEMSEFEDLLNCMSTLKILPGFDLQTHRIDLDQFGQALLNLIEIIADLDPIQHKLDANSVDVVEAILRHLFYRLNSELFYNDFYKQILGFKHLYLFDRKLLLATIKKSYTCFNKDLFSVTFNGHTAHLGINLFRIYHGLGEDLKRQLPAKLLFKAIDSVTYSPEAFSISSPKELEQRILDKFIKNIKEYVATPANVNFAEMD